MPNIDDDPMICGICGESMERIEWTWGDELAHKECVLKEAESICSKGCCWFSIGSLESGCEICGAEMRKITDEDKEFWRKKGDECLEKEN